MNNILSLLDEPAGTVAHRVAWFLESSGNGDLSASEFVVALLERAGLVAPDGRPRPIVLEFVGAGVARLLEGRPVAPIEVADGDQGLGDDVLMLSNEDGDCGLCRREDAMESGQDIATEDQRIVTLRDPISDEIIATFWPAPPEPLSFVDWLQQSDI